MAQRRETLRTKFSNRNFRGLSLLFQSLSVAFFANQLPYFTCTAGFWSVKILKRSANDRDCKKPMENGRRRCRCSQESWCEKKSGAFTENRWRCLSCIFEAKKVHAAAPAIFNSRFDLNLEGRSREKNLPQFGIGIANRQKLLCGADQSRSLPLLPRRRFVRERDSTDYILVHVKTVATGGTY